MDPLTTLANQITNTFGIGDQSSALGVQQYGYPIQQAMLGDVADVIADPSAERRYTEEGFFRVDPFTVEAQQFETLLQEPNITVLVKKRAFSTLSENYRMDFMSSEEKLYLKATRFLFQNKCQLIQTFEKLSKIARVSSATGQLDTSMMPTIIDLVTQASTAFSTLSNYSNAGGAFSTYNAAINQAEADGFTQLSSVVQKIQQIWAFSQPNNYTTWITPPVPIFTSTLGMGTGVIEITNVSGVNTSVGVNFNQSYTTQLTIQDPYKMMLITDSDIEWALSDALNYVTNNAVYQLGASSLDSIAANDIVQLNAAREARGASDIEVIAGPDPISGMPVVQTIIEFNGTPINFTYDYSSTLIGAIAGGGVTIDPASLQGSSTVGDEGLSPTEVGLFTTMISDQYAALNFKQAPAIAPVGDFTDPSGQSTLDVNYVRRKMRLHYGNKLIIQSMDRVHVYIGSKSQTDNEVLGTVINPFSGFGFLSQAGNLTNNISNQPSTAFNPAANIDLMLEKEVFLGVDFPTDLWAMMRNTFIDDKSGCHVFGGVVESASESYSPGNYVVTVDVRDNTHFFDFGTVNINPGADTFLGPLYDPLTPFVTTTDTVTTNYSNQTPTLLPDNLALLSSQTYNSGLIRYKSGGNFGKPVTQANFFTDKQVDGDGTIRALYHMPDGFAYTWKEGIGVFTYNADSFNATNPATIGKPTILTKPLAGQDVINGLSILIAGVPYNYSTFFQSLTLTGQSTSLDPQSGQSPAATYFDYLSNTLAENNMLWGDFIPFKNVTIDPATAQAMMYQQANITNQNATITSTLQQIQGLQNQLFLNKFATTILAGNSPSANGGNTATNTSNISSQLSAAQATLSNQISQVQQSLQSSLPITIAGNDVSQQPSSSTYGQSATDTSIGQALRRESNLLGRRLSWAVRANQDKNYLIVDDAFEKDPDIANMTVQFQGVSQFQNQYTTIRDQIDMYKTSLNLEIFADTQGHIRIRPQQYNKMPSSVFYRMMQIKQNNGIQVYPDFLETLFVNQIGSLINQVSIIEAEIRLDGAVIGIVDDTTLAAAMNASGVNTVGSFTFISNRDGTITSLSGVQTAANPDLSIADIPTSFDTSIDAQSSLNSVFNVADRAKLSTATITSTTVSTSITSTAVQQLSTLIQTLSGTQPVLNNFVLPSQSGVLTQAATARVDVLSVTDDMAAKVSQRQQILTQLASALTNAREAASLTSDPNDTSNSAQVPNLYGNSNIPQVFLNMIEDETFDDLGPGSGTRYVIHDYQIISLQLGENPPEYNMLEVQGALAIVGNALPQNLQAFPTQGNALVTAAAVDYDLWRQYGLRGGTNMSISTPFFTNPENQCGPFAAMMLSRARKNIIRGTLTIAGNEYMQPGEVIFIESRGLLFYVESVQHSFTFGSKFTTTLTLTYGHNPGEFIPTPLDIVGKLIYNNRDTAHSVAYRNNTTTINETPLGALILNPQSTSGSLSSMDSLTSGTYGDFNLQAINQILLRSYGLFNNNQSSGSNLSPIVEIRIFYNSQNGSPASSLTSAASTLQSILTGTAQPPSSTLSTNASQSFSLYLQPSQVATANIDSSSTSEYRSPSQKAVDAARNVADSFPGAAGSPSDPVGAAMSQFILDVVAKFQNSTPTNAGSTTPIGS